MIEACVMVAEASVNTAAAFLNISLWTSLMPLSRRGLCLASAVPPHCSEWLQQSALFSSLSTLREAKMFFSTDAGGIELQKLNFSVAFIFILRSERVGGKSVEYLKRFWLCFF